MRRLERLHKEGARRDRNAEAAQPLSGRGSRALDQPLPSALTDAFSDTRRGVNTVDHSYTSTRSTFQVLPLVRRPFGRGPLQATTASPASLEQRPLNLLSDCVSAVRPPPWRGMHSPGTPVRILIACCPTFELR